VLAPNEDKDDLKDSFHEELEQVLDHFHRHNTKILLGDFNAKVGREGILQQTIGRVYMKSVTRGSD
jgi:hypothetical protein